MWQVLNMGTPDLGQFPDKREQKPGDFTKNVLVSEEHCT